MEFAGTAAPRPPTVHETARMSSAPGVGCWSQYRYYKWYDLGINIGDTWMTAHWCSDGTTITSHSLSDRGGQGYHGVRYDGLGSSYVRNLGSEVRQAQVFKFGFLWASATPCMQIRGSRTGVGAFEASCDTS